MRIVIQRVSHASVTIEGEVKSAIRQGYLILLGIEESDTSEDVDWLVRKVIGLRVFDDENHVMNRSIMPIRQLQERKPSKLAQSSQARNQRSTL